MTTVVGLRPVPAGPRPPPLLFPGGPAVVLGGHDPFSGGLEPSATTMYGPRGAFLAGDDGPLWVADTGHHRLLGWRSRPRQDGTPADWVLGQPDFQTEGRNAGLDRATARTMNMPTGVHRFGDRGLMVADSWNNRVLIWSSAPTLGGAEPDLILGQASPEAQEPNRGTDQPRADTMHWPFAALVVDGRLYVADAGNRRILGWRSLPTETGQPADFVLGQPDLEARSDNAGGPADARTMRWPHDLTVTEGKLAVADAGNNRILIFTGAPEDNHVAAETVLGQPDFAGVDHNRGEYLPTERALNMPYALDAAGAALAIVDTANSRLVGFDVPLKNDSAAVISDTGNHRVVLWALTEGGRAG